MRVNQYQCDSCKKREDAAVAEESQLWILLKCEAVHKDGDSYKVATAHVCPYCADLWLKHIGVAENYFATSFREDIDTVRAKP